MDTRNQRHMRLRYGRCYDIVVVSLFFSDSVCLIIGRFLAFFFFCKFNGTLITAAVRSAGGGANGHHCFCNRAPLSIFLISDFMNFSEQSKTLVSYFFAERLCCSLTSKYAFFVLSTVIFSGLLLVFFLVRVQTFILVQL